VTDKQSIQRLMIVTGDDNFAIELSHDNYLKRIKARHGKDAEYVVEVFDSVNERVGNFMSRAMTASLFGEIRVYCVLHAQELSEKDLTALDKSLDYEIPDVYIFIAAEYDNKDAAKKKAAGDKISKTLRLKSRADDASIAIKSCIRPYDEKIAPWIVEQVPLLLDRYIGTPEAEILADMVEYELLISELKKIDLALEPGARIDKKIIEEVVGATKTMNQFDLVKALGKRDLPAALNILDSLFATDFDAPLVVSAVFKHFWALMKIRKYLKRNPHLIKQYNSRGFGKDSPQQLAAIEIGIAVGLLTEKTKGGVYPKVIKDGIVNQAQSFSEKGLRDIIGMLQRFDVDVKTGKTEPIHVQMLCYKIARAA